MRILFINRYYAPDQSGTSRMVTELAQDLARMGMGVTVVASDGDSGQPDHRYPRRERLDGVDVYRTPTWRFSRGTVRGWVLNSLSFYPMALWHVVRLRRHDVVVFVSDPPLLHALGPVIRLLKGSHIVCWCQDVYPDVAIRLGILKEWSWPAELLRLLSGWGLRRADRVVAIGELMADRLLRRGAVGNTIAVIPNWADGGRIRPVPAEQNSFVRRHGLEGQFVVLYSGNMGVANIFDTVVAATRRLARRERMHFLFIGDGKQRARLVEQLEGLPSVSFLPAQSDDDLAQSLGAGSVHLVTLRAGLEGLIVPSKLYGAMAAGRPVIFIGPPVSEAARTIEQAGCGFVVPPDDEPGLVKAISALADDPAMGDRLGRNGRAYFERYHHRPPAVERFAALLHDAAREPARPSAAKRLVDLAFSGLGLMVSAPLWALFALLVRLEDRGPVFFRDRRVGQGGREFGALKFRTMVPDADATVGPLQAREGDPRVTRIGRLLRATAMDELPQLWNIFRGEMSVVGPRALRPVEVEARAPGGGAVSLFDFSGATQRQLVRPGLTGLAQVFAPRDLVRRHKFRYDLLYVRRRSLWLDFQLILSSFWITLTGSWERPGHRLRLRAITQRGRRRRERQ